jgi:NAD-dependent SIR2 family protein deacetylase
MTDPAAATPDAVQHAADLIEQADALVVGAGAGMGVDSGLPDFRGHEGFWKAYPALGAADIAFSSIASPRAFHSDPTLAWGFYGHRLALYRRTRPHDGYRVLLQWAERMLFGASVFTSNVDGQFQQAGFAEQGVHECHGSIHWLQCLRPCSNTVWRADNLVPEIDDKACRWLGKLPTCPWCGSIARPNVLMFGDPDWSAQRYREQELRLVLSPTEN